MTQQKLFSVIMSITIGNTQVEHPFFIILILDYYNNITECSLKAT
jgi:hypothetical protein